MVVGENNVVKRCVTLPLKGETEASLEGCERTGKHPVNVPQSLATGPYQQCRQSCCRDCISMGRYCEETTGRRNLSFDNRSLNVRGGALTGIRGIKGAHLEWSGQSQRPESRFIRDLHSSYHQCYVP